MGSIAAVSEQASKSCKETSGSLSPNGCSGRVDLTIFDDYLDKPITNMCELIVPGAVQGFVEKATDAIQKKALKDKGEFAKMAADFIASMAKGKIADYTADHPLYIQIGKKDLTMMISFTYSAGVKVQTDPSKFLGLKKKCESNEAGHKIQRISVLPGKTWKDVKEAILAQQHKKFNCVAHNSKDYTNGITEKMT